MLWAALALSSGIRLGSVAGVQQCGWLAAGFFQFAAIALFAEGRGVVIPGRATREGELAVDNSFAGGHAIRICPGCRLPGKHFRTDLDSGVMSYLNRRR
jgi:hypothetical protein